VKKYPAAGYFFEEMVVAVGQEGQAGRRPVRGKPICAARKTLRLMALSIARWGDDKSERVA
jgi:hypothetical protein